jgi:hypothetical protein
VVSVLESKGWKKVKVLDDSESRKPFTKEIADAEAYRVKRAMGGNAVSRKEAGSWVIYHLSPPKKTGVAALNEIKKATKNSGWTVTHMGKNGNSSTTIKNEYKKPRKQTGVSVNFANLYPPKFKGQYKFVKYEFDNHGQITFDVNDRLSGLFYRDIPGNQGHTKAGLVKYIKSQIDMNPNWIRIGTSTRKKGAKKTSEEPIEGKRWEVTQNKPTAGKKAAPKQSGLIKTASVKKTAPKKAKPVKKVVVKKTAPKKAKPVKKVVVKKTAPKKAKPVKKMAVKKTRVNPSQTFSVGPKLYQTGKSSKLHDERKTAKKPGKRVSSSGRVYYEYRRNRSDMPGSSI